MSLKVRKQVNGVRKALHVHIAEKVLGRELRGEEQVHHLDGNGANNSPKNLVICPTQAYHSLLHVRLRAYQECGDPNKRRCAVCKEYKNPDDMLYVVSDTVNGKLRCTTCRFPSRKQKIYAKLAKLKGY